MEGGKRHCAPPFPTRGGEEGLSHPTLLFHRLFNHCIFNTPFVQLKQHLPFWIHDQCDPAYRPYPRVACVRAEAHINLARVNRGKIQIKFEMCFYFHWPCVCNARTTLRRSLESFWPKETPPPPRQSIPVLCLLEHNHWSRERGILDPKGSVP